MKKRGFTLFELILYVSITSTILVAVIGFAFLLLSVQVKSQVITEVEQQGIQVLQIVSQHIRNAETITSPTAGSSASSLTLDDEGVTIVFSESDGEFQMTEDGGDSISLTNDRVTISGLNFTNLTKTGTPSIIRTEFTITHVNLEGRNEYDYSKTFYTSSQVRTP